MLYVFTVNRFRKTEVMFLVIHLICVLFTFVCLFVCFFSGLGQNDSEFIDISNVQKGVKEFLSELFIRAGFARALTTSKDRLLPCPLGTFVNKSVTDANGLKCLECPAGKFFLSMWHQMSKLRAKLLNPAKPVAGYIGYKIKENTSTFSIGLITLRLNFNAFLKICGIPETQNG